MLSSKLSKRIASRRDVGSTILDSGLEIISGRNLVATEDARLPSIYELYREAMGMNTPPDTTRFRDNLASSTAILYPTEDDVAGMCLWQVPHRRIGRIVALAVENDRHRNGIGSEMIAAALRGMEDSGVRTVMVDALVTPQAVSFYEKQGFTRTSDNAPGARPDIPMQRSLPDAS